MASATFEGVRGVRTAGRPRAVASRRAYWLGAGASLLMAGGYAGVVLGVRWLLGAVL